MEIDGEKFIIEEAIFGHWVTSVAKNTWLVH